MKRKLLTLVLSAALSVAMLAGCGSTSQAPAETTETVVEETAETENTETAVEETTETAETETAETETVEEDPRAAAEALEATGVTVRVGSLKGATSIGLLSLMHRSEKAETANDYEFEMKTAADELLPMMISGDLDIALVPANVASVLYNKTKGAISVIDINTLGVLYMVSADTSLTSIADLKGKTIYLTGKGTTPDYVLHYILSENGLTDSDVTLEYKSEATEVAAVLAESEDAIALLPQPFVTAACAQNEKLQVIFDMTQEWNSIQGEGGSSLVTGVTIVRNDFLNENPEAVQAFMVEHKASAAFIPDNLELVAQWTEEEGIIAKAAIAQKAIPFCNITYIDGTEMKQALSGYLQVLFDQDPTSVGGALPEDSFYAK